MASAGFGSQTNGSMLRPASYCGVYGIKPSFGLLPRTGLQPIAAAVDTAGLFSRDLEGFALAMEAVAGPDPDDPDSLGVRASGLTEAVRNGAGRHWRVGVSAGPPSGIAATPMRGPAWRRLSSGWAPAPKCSTSNCPSVSRRCTNITWRSRMRAWRSNRRRSPHASPAVSDASLLENIRRGQAIPPSRVADARGFQAWARAAMDAVFGDIDVIIGLAATGEAPATLAMTGDPVMQTIWTFTGTPALSVPALRGARGLPIGVQVIARRQMDARVLGFAAFLEQNGLVPERGTAA